MADRTFIIEIHGLKTVAYRSDVVSNLYEVLFGAVFEPPTGMTLQNIVGYADFEIDNDGLLYATAVMVDSNHQRQGIASAMYNMIEACYHTKVRPASLQTPDAKKFWEKRNESTLVQSLPQKDHILGDCQHIGRNSDMPGMHCREAGTISRESAPAEQIRRRCAYHSALRHTPGRCSHDLPSLPR